MAKSYVSLSKRGHHIRPGGARLVKIRGSYLVAPFTSERNIHTTYILLPLQIISNTIYFVCSTVVEVSLI